MMQSETLQRQLLQLEKLLKELVKRVFLKAEEV
jgi:hypothetical protein